MERKSSSNLQKKLTLQKKVIFDKIYTSNLNIVAKIAQLVEQPLRKRQVRGSIPRLGSFCCPFFRYTSFSLSRIPPPPARPASMAPALRPRLAKKSFTKSTGRKASSARPACKKTPSGNLCREILPVLATRLPIFPLYLTKQEERQILIL